MLIYTWGRLKISIHIYTKHLYISYIESKLNCTQFNCVCTITIKRKTEKEIYKLPAFKFEMEKQS